MENNKSEELAIKKLEDEKIYRRLTINMQNKMAKFKDARSTKGSLNTQLIINISSLCRFLRKKEEDKKKQEEEREIRKNKKINLENELESRQHDYQKVESQVARHASTLFGRSRFRGRARLRAVARGTLAARARAFARARLRRFHS